MVKYLFPFFFFFSSRRRHTRSLRDWSSDVCSSDLSLPPTTDAPFGRSATIVRWTTCSRSRTRSEERRVGKECRSRWALYLENKKASETVIIRSGICNREAKRNREVRA